MGSQSIRRLLDSIGIARSIRRRWRRKHGPDSFLAGLRGVIHVGANKGQERKLYADHRLDVLWIEPIPEIFQLLEQRIARYEKQRAVQALISDVDGAQHILHIASNGGMSSSILALAQHRDIWPEIHYVGAIKIKGVTLPTLLGREGIDISRYDGLILDTQGTELSILRGARSILPQFRLIKTEVADFEAYVGCALLPDMERFLQEQGFREVERTCQAVRRAGGKYYEVLFARTT